MKTYQLIAACLLLSACADNGYRAVVFEGDYGHSVKQITQAQYLNPKAAANPPITQSKKGLDGLAGQNIIRTYRNSFGTQQQIQPVNINVGSNSNLSSSGQ